MKLNMLSFLFLSLMNFHLHAELINEDGNQIVSSVILGKNKTSHQEYIKALNKESIQVHFSSKYEWAQDIFFSNKNGEILLMPDFAQSSFLFADFSLGVFESYGGSGKLLKVEDEDVLAFNLKTKKLSSLYLEGGATISGEFPNGELYIIILSERYEKSKRGAESLLNKTLTDEEFRKLIFDDYNVRDENIILLPKEIGQEHLDLFIKAMPDGVLLIDDPEVKLNYIESLLGLNNNEVDKLYLKQVLDFETAEHLKNKREAYRRKIGIVKDTLKQYFKIISIPGRFFSLINDEYQRSLVYERTNFFNSFNGINKFDKLPYFFTNTSPANILENDWSNFLTIQFNINSHRIYYVFEYSEGAGLDCKGAMIGYKNDD